MTVSSVLIATPAFPPGPGGAARYADGLAQVLRARHGLRVVVATAAGPDAPAGVHDRPDGIRVHRIAVPAAPASGAAHWLRGMRHIVAEEAVDVVDVHAGAPLLAGAAARACADTPFVLTYHGGPATGAVRAAYDRTVLAATAYRAQEAVCSCECVAAALPALVAARATTIAPGVDPGDFPRRPPAPAPQILFAGPRSGTAGFDGLAEVLRAAGRLARTVPEVRVEVSGRAATAAERARRARRARSGHGLVVPARPAAGTPAEAYGRARVVVVSAGHDEYAAVLAEAAACGRPVVVLHPGGAAPRTSGGHLWHLAAGDAAGLVAVLDRALGGDVPAGGHSGDAAPDTAWERQADRTAAVLERALDRGRRRTLAVVSPYYPPNVGGAENYAQRIAHAAAGEPGFRAAVITSNTAGRRTSVEGGDVPVVRLGTWARLSNTPVSPLWPFQVRLWLRRLGADAVNAHAPVPGLGDLAVLLSGPRPTVLTYHSGSMRKGRGHLDAVIGLYERHILPRVFRRACALAPVSPVSLASGRPHATQITPGVDLDRFTPGPPPSARARTLLYVGRMERASAWKGVDVLVRAFALLGDRPGTRLRLVGGGDAVPDHKALAERLGVGDRVDFAGELFGDDLVGAVQGAAAFVLPSLSEAECHPIALMEAMACGTPVVGSDVGGIAYIVSPGVTGLLAPPGDAEALAGACRRVLDESGLGDRLGAAARAWAVERYPWPVLTGRYVALLRALLSADHADRCHRSGHGRRGSQPRSPAMAPRRASNAGLALPSALRRP
ncbi:glycosyltransferase [Streptomyces genisteinicus]|uniref:Glycosyltransferase n=1 Tax=Streptomyces genisteinicus TaxID=2768068 RepID=A0A7H0HQW0_9ACTN|nr:glycosyltransferase [Streptomyces genisteinicus]QNP62926.1 glycosyltransferase [Streptomyces genisteinicus]